MTRKLKIFFHVIDLVGPQNACIGMGQSLLQRGHEVFFLINEQFANCFNAYGFVECLLKEDATRIKQRTNAKDPIKQVCDDLIKVGLFANMSTVENLKKLGQLDYIEDMFSKAADFEPQIKALLESEKPDVIVFDCDVVAPCLINSGVPFVHLWSANPVALFDSEHLPPFTSGFPMDSDYKLWKEYRKVEHDALTGKVANYQRKLSQHFGYPSKVDQKYLPHSPYLNIYQYPEELDYHDVITIPSNFLRVDACCRSDVGHFQMPDKFKQKIKPGNKLIYVSMGSMGSADVKLMKRLVAILSQTPHFYIVSKGLLHDQYELADNMWGEAYLPQTKVLPLVDMVITHGGNNTLLEAITFAKPVIVMPFFFDQFINAQRVQEKGLGIRIQLYDFEDRQLVEAIEQILANQELKVKYVKMATRIAENNSKEKACVEIEKVADKFKCRFNSA